MPDGELAVVGPTLIGPDDVAAARAQVGAYGQLRFSGPEGRVSMLEALVTAELLALEAQDAGLGDDPRVRFAELEEIATVHLTAELERRVPRSAVAQDTEALRAYYDQHSDAFTDPERRSAQGVVFSEFEAAQQALAALRGGTSSLEELGDLVATPLQARDDGEYPAFHPFLFAPQVGQGDFMPHPVFVGESVLVGRVQSVEPARVRPFEDEQVQEQLVSAVLAPLRDAARAEILAELRDDG